MIFISGEGLPDGSSHSIRERNLELKNGRRMNEENLEF